MQKRLTELAACIDEQVAIEIYELPFVRAGDLHDDIDAACVKCGLKPIGKKWREITAASAEAFLRYHIAHDLAYEYAELVNSETAASWARELISFYPDGRWFTSHSAVQFPNSGYGYDPLTAWTFSLGYICLSNCMILLIVFQAED